MTDIAAPQVDADVEFRLLPIEQIEPNPWNPNAMNQEELDRLIQEIEEVGFIDAIQAVPLESGKFRIIGGEHRVEAARSLDYAHVPSMVLIGPRWQDEELQQLVTIRLNVLHGKLNPEKMAQLYHKMAKKYGEDALKNLFAFTDKQAWDKLVSNIKQGLGKSGLPPDKQQEFDDKAKEAKTLKDLERILNELWSSYGDTMHQSFMIFTYGKREHVYVAMNKKTRQAMDVVIKHCRDEVKDINDVLGPAIVGLANVLKKKKPKAKPKPKKVTEDDVAF